MAKKRIIKNDLNYIDEWKKTHTKRYGIILNLNTDKDIIAKLDSVKSKNGYIRKLIRDDISNSQNEKEKN